VNPEKKNRDVMTPDFEAVSKDASLKKAFDGIRKALEKAPYPFGLVVIGQEGKYAGLLTLDDFMSELRQLYRDACDKPGRTEWTSRFFSECEVLGSKKVSEIMSCKRLSVRSDDRFERSCELVLYKRLNLLAVVDEELRPVGIITRRDVLAEIGQRMFK